MLAVGGRNGRNTQNPTRNIVGLGTSLRSSHADGSGRDADFLLFESARVGIHTSVVTATGNAPPAAAP